MAHFSFEVTRPDAARVSVLVASGALDIVSCRRLSSAVNEMLGTGPEGLVIDVCAVEFVDSTGLAILVQARRRALRAGIELRLVCDAPTTLKVLALTGLSRSFDIYPTREDALEPSSPMA